MRPGRPLLALLVLAGCEPDSNIGKFNSEPVATITSHEDGDAVTEQAVFTLRGTVSDTNDSADRLTASWFAGARELCASAPVESDGSTTCEATLELGESVVTLQGQDPSNALATDEVTLEVLETGTPTATISAPVAGGTYYSDQPIQVEAVVADEEDDATDLVVAWTDGDGGTLDLDTDPDTTGDLSDTIELAAGEHTLRLDVTDSSGKTSGTEVTFTVGGPNTAPTCTITAPASGSVAGVGDTVTLAGEVNDADVAEDLLSATWSSDVDGELGTSTVDEDGVTTFDVDDLSIGTHTLTLTGADEVGATCTATVTLVVGMGPEVGIDSPTDGDLYNEGEAVTFLGTVSDDATAPELLEVEWSSDLDGLLDTTAADSSGLATFDTSALTAGDHVVTLLVTDEDGISASASVSFTVNGLPTAPGISITPASPLNDDDLVVSIDTDSVDPEGDAVSYTYAWTVNGTASAYTTDTVPASATSHGDTWEVTVTPNDGSGDGAPATTAVMVENQAPTLASVTLSPDPAYEGDTLTCEIGATSDADGDTVSTSVAWEVNGVLVAATTTTLGDTWWARGDTVTCTVTPNDGYVDGAAVTSNAVTIDDSTPSITGVAIDPDPAYASDTLTCSTSGWSDADGDTEATTFEWFVGGVSVATGSTLSGAFVAGDTVTCEATPSDGTYAGSALDTSVVIENSLPILAGVTITPSSPTSSDVLTCVPGATTDADGTTSFTYTYAWSVDGATLSETGTTLSGEFSHGDLVRCTVTPNDGIEDGSPVASSAVTVLNSAPAVTSVTLAPTSPAEGDTITATVASADADGDTVSYTYTWWVDGASVAATTSTLSSAYFGRGDSVYVSVVPTDGTDSGPAVSSTAVTVVNSAPSISSVSITPASPTVSDALLCTSSGYTDPDGDSDASSFVWSIDGVDVGTGSALSSGYASGDEVVCTVTPSDGTDTGTTRTASVTIRNSAPSLASVALTPTSATEGSTLTCTPGATTDADGTSSFSYTYAWYVEGTLVPPATSTLSGTWFDAGEDVYCSVTPSDGASSGSAVSSNVVTIGNSAPVVSSVSLTPTTASVSSTLTCTPTATDADGDSISYTYAWYVDGALVGASGTTLTSTYFATGDAVYCAVTPTDGTDSGSTVSSSSVTISNTAPVLASVTLTPTTAYETSTLTCTPSATDADGDSVSFTYAWYVNGSAVAATSSTLTGTDFSSGDSVYCRATPDDGTTTGTAMSSSTLTISNSTPSVTSVTLTPTTAYEASTLTCTPAATDADGTTSFSYTYRWYVNGSLAAPTSSTITGTYFSSGDTVYCSVTASDGSASSGSLASSTVTISNTAPVLSSVSLTPASPTISSTLTCTPSATDADGDTVSYTYAWYVNSSAVAGTSATLTSTYFDSGDTVYCRVTPTDGSTSGTAMSSSTVTVGNTAPVMASVSLTPTTAYEASTLTCTPSATDSDGDSVSYTYAWYVNSSLTAATGSTLTGTYFSSGSTVYCRVTPSDGTTSGTAMSSSSVTISNTAPVISSVSLTPTTAYEASTLTCTPTTTDADGTTSFSYTYNWYVNGSLIAPTSSTLTGTYFSKSNTVYCTATASDGSSASSTVSSSTVTISNTAPVISSVSLSPTLVYTNDTITASVSATDADGDSISYSYAWYVNSSAVAATSSTLSGTTYFSKGNTVYVRVTPTDGSTSGTAMSSSTLTVGNSAPSAPTVVITPEDPEAATDAIVCEVDTSSSDADGDTVTYTFAWTKNGSTYSGASSTSTTSTVPASATAENDVFVCTVTPSDGSTSGSSATDSVTVLGPLYYVGHTSTYSSNTNLGLGYLYAQSITLSSAADLYTLAIIYHSTNTSNVKLALYTNSGGAPGTLLGYTGAGTGTGATELDVTTAPVSLSAGTYWIAWTHDSGTYGRVRYTTSGCSSNTVYYKSSTAYSSGFPASFGSASSATNQCYNLYAGVR